MPRTFVAIAAGFLVAFLVAHALGWRADVAFLSGTVPVGGSRSLSLLRGVTYVLAYLGFILVAPTLVIAAALIAGAGVIRRLVARAWRGRRQAQRFRAHR